MLRFYQRQPEPHWPGIPLLTFPSENSCFMYVKDVLNNQIRVWVKINTHYFDYLNVIPGTIMIL